MTEPNQDFQDINSKLIKELIAACESTRFGLYFPEADIVIRFRGGKVLPVLEIRRKVEVKLPRDSKF